MRQLAAATKEKLQQRAKAVFENNTLNASPDVIELLYDEAGHFMRVVSKVTAPDLGTIRSIDINFPTKSGMLTFKFAAKETEYEQYADLFSAIIKNIEPSKRTEQRTNTTSSEEKPDGHRWEDFIAGKIIPSIVLVLALGYVGRIKKKQKSEKNTPAARHDDGPNQ
jgi:hypothetical protein